jgi:hypothetical protein
LAAGRLLWRVEAFFFIGIFLILQAVSPKRCVLRVQGYQFKHQQFLLTKNNKSIYGYEAKCIHSGAHYDCRKRLVRILLSLHGQSAQRFNLARDV